MLTLTMSDVFCGRTIVGHVDNARFDPAFTAVLWDPPSTADILDSVHYQVTVVNNDTGVTVVNDVT